MPIYEYACVANGHRFEVFQKMSDPAPESCPSCGAAEVRKLVSASAFVLKGGGWYRDHYGLKSGGSSSESSGSSTSESSASSASTPATPSTGGSSGASTSASSSSTGSSSGGSSGGSSAPAST